MKTNYSKLKARQRNEREAYPSNMGLRVHRALSWLDRAEQCKHDQDGEFIFLWISFNAAYANDIDPSIGVSEQKTFQYFLNKLCELDKKRNIYNFIWSEFARSIRILLHNKFVFQSFWDYNNNKISQTTWVKRFDKENSIANRALGNKDTGTILAIIFSRLYTLRNQLLHGGATWNSVVNRDQIRDAVNFLGKLVPIIIEIMMDNAKVFVGEPRYPMVEIF